jgi:hypothetical protein
MSGFETTETESSTPGKTSGDVVKAVDDDLDQQRELFLWKFKDISREEITKEYNDFVKHDLKHHGELDEHETLMFLEHRNETKTALELRALIAEIDKDKNHKLNFLEWCCFYFKKSYEDLNDFVDEEARQKALAEARAAGEAARRAQEKIDEAKKKEEEDAEKEAAEIAEEKKLKGVAGAAAMFNRAAKDQTTPDIATKIKEESARKRELRAAKKAEEDAKAEAGKVKTAEEVQAEIIENAKKAAEEKARLIQEAKDKEKADRKARIAAMNARTMGTNNGKSGKES